LLPAKLLPKQKRQKQNNGAAYGLIEKTDQSVKEVPDKIKKASIEVVDKSTQTIAIVAGKTVKQGTIAKKETVAKGKNGTGSTKAVSKTAKPVKK
jgi:hypothetical protein